MQLANEQEKEIVKQIHFLAVLIYKATRSFPICESKGLIAEMRQCALASGAFLSDSLRKHQKIYILDALSAVQKHVSVLRRDLFTAHMLTYLSVDEFETLDQQALLVQERILLWQDRLDEEESIRPNHVAAPSKNPNHSDIRV